jgi:hypothetical protein
VPAGLSVTVRASVSSRPQNASIELFAAVSLPSRDILLKVPGIWGLQLANAVPAQIVDRRS